LLNQSAYAISFKNWWLSGGSGAFANWTELDRQSRSIFSQAVAQTTSGFGALPSAFSSYSQMAPFGTVSIETNLAWKASTSYSIGNYVSPSPGNGFYYFATTAGSSGSSQPTFPTTFAATVVDSGVTWRCDIPVAPGNVPALLVADASLQTQTCLQARASSATAIAGSVGNPGAPGSLSVANSAWTTAISSRPTPNPTTDANSTSLINALQSALANCNAWLSSLSFT
jgi:hypothetical protein